MDSESLSDLFWAVARQMRHLSKLALEPWNISPSQWRALATLHRHGELRLSSLADHLRIAPRSTTEVVDDLESRGLVSRQPDPTDRRAVLVTLTDAGKAVADGVDRARQAEGERLFSALDPTDRADLARVLRKLQD
ncbi:DNA-binding MarR family transcriptional regulator [Hamadaea flava]|uniref:MarR family winged helix-turn-helix transcriptional regulator n=1 Tax=Hamadaea flava TaxID=1742688 RepID=A0ABV8LQ94_9ACTN|nr:MarR family transcriptional regulator [Hamadaea flava]MCP2322885.1 DNA-binding MarR family transcriptional regulator [Hamadaea flava]